MDIASLVKRFHNNLDRLTMASIMDMDIQFISGNNRIVTSPKNIDSYDTFRELKSVVDEIESRQTRKEKETEAKSGVDKLYEDDRWLLVRPNTHEGSCYYGSATKWCTSAKDAKHFDDYSKSGNLFYIIDKSKDVGDFFKIALHKKWNGEEEWYDRADNKLEEETEEAIRSLLPAKLVDALELEHSETKEEKIKPLSLIEFKQELDNHVSNLPKGIRYSTQTGKWKLEIRNGKWEWYGTDPRIELVATPFFNGDPGVNVYVQTDDDDLGQPVVEYGEYVELDDLHTEWLGPSEEYQMNYLSREGTGRFAVGSMVQFFIRELYMPIVSEALNHSQIKEYTRQDYKTWDSTSYVSSYTFKYPPKKVQ